MLVHPPAGLSDCRRETPTRRLGTSAATVLFLLAVALVVTASPAAAAGNSSGDAAQFVQLVNGERTSRGLGALSTHGELTGLAVRHSRRMAADANGDGRCNDSDALRHRSDVSRGVTADWRSLSENVGYYCPAEVRALHDNLMSSPGHRANILDGGKHDVGVGAYHDADGGLWVTQIFMETRSGPESQEQSPSPEPGTQDEQETEQQQSDDRAGSGGSGTDEPEQTQEGTTSPAPENGSTPERDASGGDPGDTEQPSPEPTAGQQDRDPDPSGDGGRNGTSGAGEADPQPADDGRTGEQPDRGASEGDEGDVREDDPQAPVTTAAVDTDRAGAAGTAGGGEGWLARLVAALEALWAALAALSL